MNRTALWLCACLVLLIGSLTTTHAYIPSGLIQRLEGGLQGATRFVPSAQTKDDNQDADSNPSTGRHRRDHEVVQVGSAYHLGVGARARQVVVVFAPATIDGKVDGDVVVVGGRATVNGEIGGNLVCPLGSATLGPEARVDGDVITVGGDLADAATSHIGGERREIAFAKFLPHVDWFVSWCRQGLFHMRPLPPGLGWAWGVACVFLLTYLAIALVLPKSVTACTAALESKPIISFFSGLLMLVAFGPLLVIMSVTVVGPLVMLAAFVAAAVLGRIAVLRFLGQQFGRGLGLELLQTPIGGLVAGAALVSLLYMVPILGLVVWATLVPLGLGAATVAAVVSFQSTATTVPGQSRPPGGGTPTPGYIPIPTSSASTTPVAQSPTPQPTSAPFAMPMTTPTPSEAVGFAAPPTYPVPPAIASAPRYAPEPSHQATLGMTAAEWCALPRAGFWLRLLATILDFIPFTIIIPFTGAGWLLVWTAYLVGMWAWRGSTLGGIVLGLKVVRIDGRQIDLPVALVRALASYFSLLVFFIGFFWAGWSREKQSWHDKIAGTVMVKVPKSMSLI